MRTQSVSSPTSFGGMNIVQKEKFPATLLNVVKGHKEIGLMADSVEFIKPDKQLKCMLSLKSYSDAMKKECVRLVLYVGNKYSALTSKISIVKDIEAKNVEELENIIKKSEF